MDELISMYEEYLKNKYPHKERIEFDVNEVLDMVYSLPDCAALVFDAKTSSYIPHDKSWIQKQVVAEKHKRLENNRIAKSQAKKFVIPGIIALLACIVALFGTMYGFSGSKLRRHQDMIHQAAKANGFDVHTEATHEELTKLIQKAMQDRESQTKEDAQADAPKGIVLEADSNAQDNGDTDDATPDEVMVDESSTQEVQPEARNNVPGQQQQEPEAILLKA
ncbi:hypothetical protein EDD11_002111 [Mortierella claussenii]|nr:hypothetical protein EDD11_002111 [Mortierella claussenii]